MTTRIGIIGYGGFGKFLDESWSADETLSVDRIAESDPVRHVEDDDRFTDDWQKVVADPELDVIAIVTPPSSHATIAVAAMEKGKHVLIEKPVALTEEDMNRIRDTRDQTIKNAAVNHMLRFNPLVERLAAWTKDGLLGDLRHASVENFAQDEDLPVEHWFWNPDQSGGILVEHAVHFIDLVESLTDARPLSVKGLRRMRNDRQEDQVLATIAYDSNLIATHYHEFSTLKSFETTTVRLHFERARVILKGWIPLGGHVEALADDRLADALATLPGWKQTGEEPLVHGDEEIRLAERAHRADRILHGEFRLAEDKQTVYANCVRSMMRDVARGVEDPSHTLRAPLEIGIRAVKTALTATEDARNEA